MAQRKVKALVTGRHALSGIYLEEGKEYQIEEEHFGDKIMAPIGWKPKPVKRQTDKPVAAESEKAAKPAAEKTSATGKEG